MINSPPGALTFRGSYPGGQQLQTTITLAGAKFNQLTAGGLTFRAFYTIL